MGMRAHNLLDGAIQKLGRKFIEDKLQLQRRKNRSLLFGFARSSA